MAMAKISSSRATVLGWLVALVVCCSGLLPFLVDVHRGPDQGNHRTEAPEQLAERVFWAFAAAEPEFRNRARRNFPNSPWSQQDDRCNFERHHARRIAERFGLSLSQVYLILDRGIRDKWPGPGGEPLSATIEPLEPRQR